MTTMIEEARWAKLRNALEQMFEGWQLENPADRADRIVYDLRRSGWRVPLPEDSKPPPRGRAARPEQVRRHIAACREAIRQGEL